MNNNEAPVAKNYAVSYAGEAKEAEAIAATTLAYNDEYVAFINYTDATYIYMYNEAVTTTIEAVDAEVDRYDSYLRGDVYGYTLEEKVHVRNEHKCPHCGEIISVDEYDDYEEVDSCCGFYGESIEDNGILDSISSDLKFKED